MSLLESGRLAYEAARQGGEDINDAVNINIPFVGVGTTNGYTDDYDTSCPFSSQAPDVVYSIIVYTAQSIEVDLWGSHYDTKVYILNSEMSVVACDDDFYGNSGPSYLRNVFLQANTVYYIVVDGGYNGAAGEYSISIVEYEPCVIDCQGEPEGEPPLVVGYHDTYNAGCASEGPEYPIQRIDGDSDGNRSFCGHTGWYLDVNSNYKRDVDWYIITVGQTGHVNITCLQEEQSALEQYRVGTCEDTYSLVQWIQPYCHSNSVTITDVPGADVWIAFGPLWLNPPEDTDVYDYQYEIIFTGLEPGEVAIENRSWTAVKLLFR